MKYSVEIVEKKSIFQNKLDAFPLAVGGVVFLQSDMEFVAVEMRDRFAAHPAYQKVGTEEWLAENPLPVPTEREIGTQKKGEPVYRALFKRATNTD
jgi:tRNA (guanine-N7-)-methyltransferase